MNRKITIEKELLTTIFQHKIEAIKHDAITTQIKRFGLYEREILEFTLSLLKKIPNPIILDVGANIGNHSLAFSLIANKVYAFEPTSIIFNMLENNITLNNITNVITINVGLSDICTQKDIHIYTLNNIGASSLEIDSNDSINETVKLITGDSFIEQQAIKKLDFIKMDIEGHELFAIKGLQKTIETFRPIVIMEWGNNIAHFSQHNALEKLFKNYHIYSIGFNYDKQALQPNKLTRIRRLIYKKLNLATVSLRPFPTYKRDNILLIPNEKLSLLIP